MIYPHALECIIFEGIENAHGKTAKFGGHSIRFDWIDDPEAKNSYAEQCGYIRGHGGFWNHHGSGGSKKWHFLKWPPYPYYELMGGNNGE